MSNPATMPKPSRTSTVRSPTRPIPTTATTPPSLHDRARQTADRHAGPGRRRRGAACAAAGLRHRHRWRHRRCPVGCIGPAQPASGRTRRGPADRLGAAHRRPPPRPARRSVQLAPPWRGGPTARCRSRRGTAARLAWPARMSQPCCGSGLRAPGLSARRWHPLLTRAHWPDPRCARYRRAPSPRRPDGSGLLHRSLGRHHRAAVRRAPPGADLHPRPGPGPVRQRRGARRAASFRHRPPRQACTCPGARHRQCRGQQQRDAAPGTAPAQRVPVPRGQRPGRCKFCIGLCCRRRRLLLSSNRSSLR